MVFYDNGAGEQYNARHNGCRSSCAGQTAPKAHPDHTVLLVQPRSNALPYLGRNVFLCVLQQVSDLYVKFVLFHLFPFIISCNLSLARCNLERDVASVQPSSLAISLWE